MCLCGHGEHVLRLPPFIVSAAQQTERHASNAKVAGAAPCRDSGHTTAQRCCTDEAERSQILPEAPFRQSSHSSEESAPLCEQGGRRCMSCWDTISTESEPVQSTGAVLKTECAATTAWGASPPLSANLPFPPWCNSSIRPCEGRSAGASPAGGTKHRDSRLSDRFAPRHQTKPVWVLVSASLKSPHAPVAQ
jgi:hypothetical protein